jgi:hypothetical protein
VTEPAEPLTPYQAEMNAALRRLACFALRAEDLFVRVNWIDHHHLEEVLKVALEELHERLAQLGSGIASAGLERRDVVLGDTQAAGQLALREVISVTHGAEPSGTDNDIHVLNLRPASLFVNANCHGRLARDNLEGCAGSA